VRDYELMVVLDPNLEDASIDAISERLAAVVGQRGGAVDSIEPWGRRRLAYPIGRFRDGIYLLCRLTMGPDAATDVERLLRLNEGVLRHLLVRPQDTPAVAAAAGA